MALVPLHSFSCLNGTSRVDKVLPEMFDHLTCIVGTSRPTTSLYTSL